MTPLAQLGYDVMRDAIQVGMGPERAWEAVAQAMARHVRESDRVRAAHTERTTMRADVFEQEIRRQISERAK